MSIEQFIDNEVKSNDVVLFMKGTPQFPQCGFSGQVVDTGGDAYLFQSVVAVIVGGTIFGGPGDYTRTAIGAVFITVLITVLVGHGASKAVEFIVYGGIILVAVAIYGRERRLRDRV